MEKKDAVIGVGVAVVLALLVLFMKGKGSGGGTTGGNTGSAAVDVMGGFQTAGTVYVPTTAETYNYNTYKGAVSYQTTTNNSQTTTETTYSAPQAPLAPPAPPLVAPAPQPVKAPPVITTTAPQTINQPTSQTGTKPAAPAPVAKAPAPAAVNPSWAGALHGGVHYATPRGGWNPGSVVDNLKSHNYSATFADQQRLAASMGIKDYRGTAAQNIQMLNTLRAAGK